MNLKYNNPLNGYGWLPMDTHSHTAALDIGHHGHFFCSPTSRARTRTHAHDLAYPESDAVMSKEVHKKKTFSYSHAVLRVDIRCPRKEGTKQWENTRAFTSRLGGNGCAA